MMSRIATFEWIAPVIAEAIICGAWSIVSTRAKTVALVATKSIGTRELTVSRRILGICCTESVL